MLGAEGGVIPGPAWRLWAGWGRAWQSSPPCIWALPSHWPPRVASSPLAWDPSQAVVSECLSLSGRFRRSLASAVPVSAQGGAACQRRQGPPPGSSTAGGTRTSRARREFNTQVASNKAKYRVCVTLTSCCPRTSGSAESPGFDINMDAILTVAAPFTCTDLLAVVRVAVSLSTGGSVSFCFASCGFGSLLGSEVGAVITLGGGSRRGEKLQAGGGTHSGECGGGSGGEGGEPCTLSGVQGPGGSSGSWGTPGGTVLVPASMFTI